MSVTRPHRWRRPAGLVGLLVCLATVGLLVVTAPGPFNTHADHLDVAVGEEAAARAYRVRVSEVSVGTEAVGTQEQPLRTEHRFVVVEVSAAVRGEQNSLDTDLVTRDGHRYHPRAEFATAGPTMTQPGFTRTYTVVFEVPTDRVPGARLLLDDERGFQVFHQAVRVDLGLTADTPVSSRPLVVVASEVGVTR